MSHTTRFERSIFIHDGDARGGKVLIRVLSDEAIAKGKTWDQFLLSQDLSSITVPFDDLMKFVAYQVRNARIAELEAMSPEEIVGFSKPVRDPHP